MELESGTLEVADAKATEQDRPGYVPAVDVAISTISLRALSPEEASLNFLKRTDGLLEGCQHEQLMDRIALSTALTNARRPAFFMRHAFHPGSMPAVLAMTCCSCAAVGHCSVSGMPMWVMGNSIIG